MNMMDIEIKNNQASHPANDAFVIFYEAIKTSNFNDLKLLFKNNILVNAPLITTGSLKGYSALHIACMEGDCDLVELLINEYHADVNVTANDAVQPIHLAVLRDQDKILQILLQANANVDAEFGQDIYIKHNKTKREWCTDFGSKITLLTYTVLSIKDDLMRTLLRNNANTSIVSYQNKTLMMYSLERSFFNALSLSSFFKDRKIINQRDNDGRHTIHYLFYLKQYGNFRYNELEPFVLRFGGPILHKLILAGADIYALIKNDQDTLILNIAAYRASDSILENLLPYYDSISQSKALYYTTLPVTDDQIKFCSIPNNPDINLPERRRKCLELVLIDLVNRLTFGLAVPHEEEKLMQELIQSDANIANIVHNYEQNFIQGVLKNQVVQYGDKSIIYYDLISLSTDSKKLQKIVRDEAFLNVLKKFSIRSEHYNYFKFLLEMRVEKAVKRVKLLRKLRTVSQLRSAIPLSYELILYIIEFLDNENLETFIDVFSSA